MSFHDKEIKGVLEFLDCSKKGLTSQEAEKRQGKYGLNQVESSHEISKIKIFVEQFKSTIVFILIIATLISAFLGEWLDATAIFIILILNAALGYIQEFKAEKAIEELRKLSAPKANVIRNSKIVEIDSKLLVPGDILLLETGEKIPADARLIEVDGLETQEAMLTGESLPIKKRIEKLSSNLEIGDQKNMLFSGTIITRGAGKAVVTSTGMHTEIGKIAGMIQETETEMTPLQKKLQKLGQRLGILTLIVSAVVFLTGIFTGQEALFMFLVAVSLAVAAIPEGMPAVITISLALGVQRMLKKNALVRRLPSVETLGSTNVICTDKTGTLTHNEMTVKKVFSNNVVSEVDGTGYKPDGEIKGRYEPLLFEIGALCNDSELVKEGWTVVGDPTEGCLLTSARKAGFKIKDLERKGPRIDSIPFDSDRKRMTTIHRAKGKNIAMTKGAPSIVLSLCTNYLVDGKVKKLTKEDKEKIMKVTKDFSSDALRVLGFAYKEVKEQKEYTESIEKEMVFVGLQAMIDPPREEVKEAIAKCKSAGIKVVMITGDHIDTASAIAKELGIEGRSIEGKEINNLKLESLVDEIGVYARVNPNHKLLIVEALKKKGNVVAMTGDGVNDAPALKKADIGIAMGITGTDVAKEASDMILTDDNFASIVNAVEEGRGIFDNIKKFVNYLLSSNLGEVLVLFLAMLIGFKVGGHLIIPLLAIQILWVNLITDSLPALALGVDPPEKGIMNRPPRKTNRGVITLNMSLNIVVIGILICFATLFLFNLALPDVEKARTIALTTLVVMEIVRLQMIRQGYHSSFISNKYLIWAIIGVICLQIIATYTPLNHVLGLVPLGLVDWAYILMVCAGMMAIGVVASYFIRHFTHERD